MSESDEGASVAATRQNSGSALYGLNAGAPGARTPSGVPANWPAGTSCARVIVACGIPMDARLSHDAIAWTGAGPLDHARRTSAHAPANFAAARRKVMVPPVTGILLRQTGARPVPSALSPKVT